MCTKLGNGNGGTLPLPLAILGILSTWGFRDILSDSQNVLKEENVHIRASDDRSSAGMGFLKYFSGGACVRRFFGLYFIPRC